MNVVLKRAGITRGATAAVLSLALGATLVSPAYADNGEISRGLIVGAIGGYALSQMQNQHQRQTVRRDYVVERPAYRSRDDDDRGGNQYAYTPATASPTQRAFNSQQRKMRVSIQYQLMQRGLYNGALDGAWGPQTSNALYAFARNQHMQGKLTTVRGSDRLFAKLLG
jgi:hypothetical protein